MILRIMSLSGEFGIMEIIESFTACRRVENLKAFQNSEVTSIKVLAGDRLSRMIFFARHMLRVCQMFSRVF